MNSYSYQKLKTCVSMPLMTRSVTSYNLIRILHNHSSKPVHNTQLFLFVNPTLSHFQLLNHPKNVDYRIAFFLTRGLHYLATVHRPKISQLKSTRSITVYASIQPGPPLPPGSPRNSWMSWIFGILVSIIIPFIGNMWAGMLKVTKEVGSTSTVEAVEQIVDVVEVMANKVDAVAEDISSDLPEGGSLKKAVDFIEDVAEKVARDARFAGQIIQKVQAVEILEDDDRMIDPNKEFGN